MTLNVWLVIGSLFWHFVADFIFQSDEMALNKSKDNGALLTHTAIYSIVWLLPVHSAIMADALPVRMYLFLPVTFVLHTIQDYFTSRYSAKLWTAGKRHAFFVNIGFDQLLHAAQLLLTYCLLLRL